MKRRLIAAALAVALGGFTYLEIHGHTPVPRFYASSITAGDIVREVAATGSLQARETVKVGTEVSGVISELDADFNSVVHKGQIIARLDPSFIQTEIEDARSALAGARAGVEQTRVALDDARTKVARAQALAARDVIPPSDLEDAEVANRLAEADLRAKEAQVVQAQGVLDQAEVDLSHTVIRAPVDGIVVARYVDVGQTVAARVEAPTLFEIAVDLTRMQLNATVDEADIGVVKPGQPVTFTVDAYPGRTFTGVVVQVRLQPDADPAAGNAVTYTTVVSVSNPGLTLRPGMTPTINIDIGRRNHVLRVRNGALRWLPTPEMFKASRQVVPPELAAATTARSRGVGGSIGYLWVLNGAELHPRKVTLGMSDGTFTEVSGPGLSEGLPVVTGEVLRR